jgi:hypothetical protein
MLGGRKPVNVVSRRIGVAEGNRTLLLNISPLTVACRRTLPTGTSAGSLLSPSLCLIVFGLASRRLSTLSAGVCVSAVNDRGVAMMMMVMATLVVILEVRNNNVSL